MKRNSLTTAVVAGIAGVAGFAGLANAVDLNPDGLGQVLIYPYYTVNIGQATVFSVVNTDSANGKAVKVRLLEGYNSREVLDFNLFLSPNDVWTAAITQVSDDGGGQISTTDHSCTVPSVKDLGPVAFKTAAFDGQTGAADGGPTSITRTREGYFELISMGDIPAGTPLYAATLHSQTGTPDAGTPSCDSSAVSGNNPALSLVPPTGGLFGAGQVVNVSQGTLYTYNADAIDGFTTSTLFSSSGLLTPSLQQANTNNSSFPGGAVAYIFGAGGTLLTLDYANGIDAVSAVFASDTLYNEYFTDPNLGAATDWVVTFPTKRFYVDTQYVGVGNPAIPPFVETFGQNIDNQSNVEVSPTLYDREEGTTTSGDVFSPPTSHPSALPYEVNVISFLSGSDQNAGVQSGVLGSALVSNIPPYGNDGWLRLGFAAGDAGAHKLRADASGQVITGLPATGFMGYNVINAQLSGGTVLANYGGLFRHRASRTCANDLTGLACS